MHKGIGVIIITLIILSFTTLPSITATDTTTIYVDPPTTTMSVANIGDTFTVNITIAEVTDLSGWQFKLYYNNTVLDCKNATEGPFLATGGNTEFIKILNNTYNATHGKANVACTLTGMGPGVTGSGVLATITFQIKADGETPLNLDDTKLLDSSLPDPNPIDHNTIDGTVHVGIHDIAIAHVIPSKTVVGRGCSVNITVSVENHGDYVETFNITVYANTTEIGTQTVSYLLNGSSTTVTFTWNTTGVPYGNYAIIANATQVPGETYTTDNTKTDGWVEVMILGDINGNGIVGSLDFGDVGKMYLIYSGVITGPPELVWRGDINGNGKVGPSDFGDVGKMYLIYSHVP
jgi:hypothetical protein